MRPDGADTIFGGDGTHGGRNDAGGDHGRDADIIAGDTANVFRVVGADQPRTGSPSRATGANSD